MLSRARQIFIVRIFLGRVHHALPAQLRIMRHVKRSVAPISRMVREEDEITLFYWVVYFLVEVFMYHKISLYLVSEMQDILNLHRHAVGSGRRNSSATFCVRSPINFNHGSIQNRWAWGGGR